MSTILDKILAQKAKEVAVLKAMGLNITPSHKADGEAFYHALAKPGLSIIGEIKRKSPSLGDIDPIEDPTQLLEAYVKGGVDAVSVLTDTVFFAGSLHDLQMVKSFNCQRPVPFLRKDFIIDSVQIAESVAAGADAILLIVAALGEQTGQLLSEAQDQGLAVLVEVHNQQELDIALAAGANIIGINNRNLKDFSENIQSSIDLRQKIPPGVLAVSESSIHSTETIEKMAGADFDAVLIGTALVKAKDPSALLQSFKKAGQ